MENTNEETSNSEHSNKEKSKNLGIKIGEINTLEVMRDTDYGYFLESKDENEVLLPNVYVM